MLDSAVQWTNHYPADFLACLAGGIVVPRVSFLAKRERRSPEGFSLAPRVALYLYEAPPPKKLQHSPANTASYEVKATDFSEIFPVNSAIHLLNIPGQKSHLM